MPVSIAVFANLLGMLQCLPSGPICGECMAIEGTFLCVLLEIYVQVARLVKRKLVAALCTDIVNFYL